MIGFESSALTLLRVTVAAELPRQTTATQAIKPAGAVARFQGQDGLDDFNGVGTVVFRMGHVIFSLKLSINRSFFP